MGKTWYLVTGADGHLGNTVVRALTARGALVRGLVLPGTVSRALRDLPLEIVKGDLLHPASLEPLFDGLPPESVQVIHTAGLVSIASGASRAVEAVNVTGTRNLLTACRRHGIRRFLYVSSVHAIPEAPMGRTMVEPERLCPRQVVGCYAKSKARATRLVLKSRSWGMEPVVVFPSGIIGPGDYGRGHLTQLVRDYLSGQLKACIRGGYDFVDVRDVAAGILSAAEKGAGGETFLLTGHFCPVPQLLEQLHQVTGLPPIRLVLPYSAAMATAPLSELYYALRRQPPLYTPYSLYTLHSNAHFSCRRAEEQLGYHRRPLEETLRDTAAFLRRLDGAKLC